MVNLKTFKNTFRRNYEVYHPDYEGKSSSINGNGLTTFMFSQFLEKLFELHFELVGGPPNKSTSVYIHYKVYLLSFNITSVQSVKVVQRYFGR